MMSLFLFYNIHCTRFNKLSKGGIFNTVNYLLNLRLLYHPFLLLKHHLLMLLHTIFICFRF